MILSKTDLIESVNEKYAKYIPYTDVNHIEVVALVYNILKYLLHTDLTTIKLSNEYQLNEQQYRLLYEMLDKIYIERIPIQYIIKEVCIYNERYMVSPATLIPRSDTEVLIDTAIKCIKSNKLIHVIDMCTGCGEIGISIACNTDNTIVDMVDIDKEALKIARQNARINNISSKVNVIQSDIFNNVVSKYDILVSNPPYISKEEYNKLSDYVKKEPYIALVSGNTGYEMYIRIFSDASKILNNLAYIFVEIGAGQADGVKEIIQQYSCYTNIQIYNDIHNVERVISCRFQKM